ncbi:hypothetical protein NPIL_620351 [Nephila pilipes]|uniref:Uncharacterized protein n=1 Tax=Nephila pilipes TaxID=299642 RepID=A0A8X6T034_NEPPI|nr:hypothetical protein NPIL_620351 [Nephila pilipes]
MSIEIRRIARRFKGLQSNVHCPDLFDVLSTFQCCGPYGLPSSYCACDMASNMDTSEALSDPITSSPSTANAVEEKANGESCRNCYGAYD